MKSKLFSLPSLLIGILSYAQTEIFFKYDEAGNQRYRGPNSAAKKAEEVEKVSEISSLISTKPQIGIDEKNFWEQVRLYPVPVHNVLTIDWSKEVDGLIESVSLFEHGSIHWKFQKQNIPDLNRRITIDMSNYNKGVYIISFTLKDGKIISRNITK
ncbi:T9SS type A sorting domain-containing protein [Chryseobacterium potabilaquae]|uniref:Secretion system C-terminal sorting domain-containing protein n=1 Tax=Chryseobacterium potabilaquae TaxID=2675057 RepID=A0A6N4X0V1_9FLAO|nr:T9SS type A sorting domain-containing protein [Chryseobacterium potabilaquae]CAA7193819.1 hypothetical protein CHRY9293_00230 [Chryseobacterium potabilaquae]